MRRWGRGAVVERALAFIAAVISLLGAPLLPAGEGVRAQDTAPARSRPAPGEPAVVWGAGGVPVADRLNPVRVQLESQDAAFAGAVTLTLSQRSFFDDRPALLELRWPVQLPAGGQ
ncbi:MAG: hypothetical protein AB1609_15255, partial [Bacillota bacterium]